MSTPHIAVIIPCYNAADTLAEAVHSALMQVAVSSIWIIDDQSTDHSRHIAEQLACQHPDKIRLLCMPTRSGASLARNWGALHVNEPHIAFLDADDVYERYALDAPAHAFRAMPELAAIHLAFHPLAWPEHYTAHEQFAQAWWRIEMLGAGNLVIKRSIYLAAGGFPHDDLFKCFCCEDIAFNLALYNDSLTIGTLFDQPGVHYRHKTGSHGERMLNGLLYAQQPEHITAADVQAADAVTERIKQSLRDVRQMLGQGNDGKVVPLVVVEKTS